MSRAAVKQPIAPIPAGIIGTHTGSLRKRFALAPRLGRGLIIMSTKKGATIIDLTTGQRRELEGPAGRKAARAELAELEAAIKATPPGPDVLRGRWSAELSWTSAGAGEPVIRLRRRLSYVDLLVEYVHPGRWRVVPPKRRPAWFSVAEDWPTEAQLVPTLREALELALDQARAGIKLACERRDTTRKDPPAEAPKRRAPKKPRAPAASGVQRSLFAGA